MKIGVAERRIFAYLTPYLWPHFIGALVCMVLYSATSGAVPYIVKGLFERFQAGDIEGLNMQPLFIIGVFGLRGIVNYGQSYLSEWVGQRIVLDLRADLDRKVLSMPLSYFDRAQTGNILSRITTDVLLVRQALTDGGAAIVRDATTLLVLTAVAFYLDPVLAALFSIIFPVVVLPLQKLSRKMRRLSRRGLDTLGGLSVLVQETIQGARVVKAFGMERYEDERFRSENERVLRLHLRAAKIKSFTGPMMEFTSACGIAGVVWYGSASLMGGERTTSGMAAFFTALMLLYDPFKKIVKANNTIQAGMGAASRVFDILDAESEPSGRPGAATIDGFHDKIEIEHVSFAYGTENVLSDVSLEVRCGEVVALVGASGGGKSTLADLIPRFYEADSGSIRIDGIDVKDIELSSLRSLIAVVTQQTFLFNDTVRNNIGYGEINRSDEDIVEAAKAANAHDFIVQLPDGYDTKIGEMGVQLSGGERQRLAIARALLKDAPILILDEATSALDSKSEQLVQAALGRLMEGRTALVIAHRLSTVRNADKIAVVDDGRIVELGTHEKLFQSGKLYRRFYDMQFDDEHTIAREQSA